MPQQEQVNGQGQTSSAARGQQDDQDQIDKEAAHEVVRSDIANTWWPQG